MNFSSFAVSSLIAYLNYYKAIYPTLNEASRANVSRFIEDCERELNRSIV